MWDLLGGSAAGDHVTTAVLRPGFKLRLQRFGNKQRSQIEGRGMRAETLPRIISDLKETNPFLHSHLLRVVCNTRVLYISCRMKVWKLNQSLPFSGFSLALSLKAL